MTDEIVVVSIKEVLDVAEENGYGKIECPWDDEAFEICGNFEIDRRDVEDELKDNPDDPWAKACLKILDEEKENKFALIKE